MNNYLLQLLKEVKTIIIPGLGALTLTNEHTGEMMFMAYLKFDDGTLAKHIAEKEGIDLNDAKNRITKFVSEVNAQLDKGESYEMHQFGTFSKAGGEITFEQWSVTSASAGPVATEVNTTAEPAEAPEAAAYQEKNSIREELPTTEPEGMGIATASAVVDNSDSANSTAEPEIMEELPDPERERAMTAIIPESTAPPVIDAPEQKPVVELTDKGFDTQKVPAAAPEEKPEVTSAPRVPINDVPEVTKHDPGVGPSPKEILEAKDVQAAQKQMNKKGAQARKSAKRTSVLYYILWGVLVLILGGATYVAVNFETLKYDFPVLAGLAGDKENATAPEPSIEDTLIAEPDPAETPVEEPVQEPAPEPVTEASVPAPPIATKPAAQPKPYNSTPPRPVASSGNSSAAIGQPDPSKPFHVIGGSFSSEANAKRFARDLMAKGQSSVTVGETGGTYRVSIASFATRDEAVAANAQLKSIVPSAWVYKWK
jgi:hypothetical protein